MTIASLKMKIINVVEMHPNIHNYMHLLSYKKEGIDLPVEVGVSIIESMKSEPKENRIKYAKVHIIKTSDGLHQQYIQVDPIDFVHFLYTIQLYVVLNF